ncbi:hypothetical protein B0T24DRAFT_648186 [Lasiosphaeria ovina]|uniref:D-isomer specific 2-hydroxyacid dehydrogenase NAD-binding domain-containing protein n=1 Tax=Lasiosphaeria ovina TaxID=92902 RepID=A0AAE0N9U1_9PEZI|nr:hypothetical protein B0T24DRAFT_648186 [Lasiosphaeria ovina]
MSSTVLTPAAQNGQRAPRDLSKDVFLMDLPVPPDQAWIDRLEARYPGFRVRWVSKAWEFTAGPFTPGQFEGITMMCSFIPQPAELLPNISYIQLTSAGADKWLSHPLYQDPNITFCTSNGTHPPQIAEWVIGSWLMMGHHFLDYANQQRQGSQIRPRPGDVRQVYDAPGMRMGILGYGAIGRQVARLGQALGMEVFAYTRTERTTAEARRDDSYCVPGTGDPDGLIPARWFHGSSREAVNEFLAQDFDLLVVSLPLTAATRRILGREQFEILAAHKKPFVSNIARGSHIDTDAIIDALTTGKIRGAALDVTDPEPLPDGHPLYSAPNLFVTPHVSWQSPHYFERVQGIIERNLESLSTGQPMINVMNREHHY